MLAVNLVNLELGTELPCCENSVKPKHSMEDRIQANETPHFGNGASRNAPCSVCLDNGWALKRSFASQIEVLDNHCRRLPIRTNRKGNSDHADCVFAFRFVGEQITVIMLQWECQFVEALDNRESVSLFDNLNVSKKVVGVSPDVCASRQRGCGRRGRFGVVRSQEHAERRRIGKHLFEKCEPVLRGFPG